MSEILAQLSQSVSAARSVEELTRPLLEMLEAVTGHDYPAAGASFFLLALLTIGANLLSDLLYGITDPRVRK